MTISWYTNKYKFTDKGLSLIEVLASLFLLSLLVTSVLSIFIPAGNWIKKASLETKASHYAASILETIRSDRTKLDSRNTGKTALELFPDYECPSARMSAEVSRVEPQAPPYNNLYDVIVTVRWSEGTAERCLQMSTIIKKE